MRRSTGAVFLLAALLPFSMLSQPLRPPATAPDTSGRRWIIAYAGDSGRMPYSVANLTNLIAVLDTAGRPEGWLCDGAILVVIRSPSGRNYATWLGEPYATGADWEGYLDTLFDQGGVVSRLDSAVKQVTRRVGAPPHPFQVSVVALYPEPKAGSIRFLGGLYDLSTVDGRIAAASAYVDSAVRRFSSEAPHEVVLDGFYWLHESVHGDEERVVAGVADRIHAVGKRFFWIPFFSAWGVNRWKRMGFDEAWLQPNYFFHPELRASRIDSAVDIASRNGMGIELEFDGRLFTRAPDFGDRLMPYLDALRRTPAVRDRSVVIFEGSGALPRLGHQRDATYRALYCQLVRTLGSSESPC